MRPTTLDRRSLSLGLLFCGAAGLAAARRPNIKLDYLGKGSLDGLVPKQIGQWKFVTSSGLVVPPEDQLANMLYSQLLTRVYSNGRSAPIMLLVAQSSGQTGLLQVHRPEVCYPAGGYQLTPVTRRDLNVGAAILPANQLSATADGRTEHILYWTRIGNHLPASWAEQRLAVATDNLRRVVPDAVLVRVSTVRHDQAGAMAEMSDFIKALLASLAPSQRRVLMV